MVNMEHEVFIVFQWSTFYSSVAFRQSRWFIASSILNSSAS